MTVPAEIAFRRAVNDGVRLSRAGQPAAAADAFAEAVRIAPGSGDAWRALGDVRHQLADRAGANTAHLRAAVLSGAEPEMAVAARAIDAGRIAEAAPVIAARLTRKPTDVAALMLAARLNLAGGGTRDAAAAMVTALALAPGLDAGWPLMRDILQALPPAEALELVTAQVRARADIAGWRALTPAMLERAGDYDAARALLEPLVAAQPDVRGGWMALGHLRKTVGDRDGAVAAYMRARALAPEAGDAWWALADLKTHCFTDADIAAMRVAQARQEDRGELAAGDGEAPAMLGLALGRALEQAGDHPAAFAAYAAAKRRRRAAVPHDREALARELATVRNGFTPACDAATSADARDRPIFIVGMPRSGSTLVEQILASHPAVEATRELDELPLLAEELSRAHRAPWPEALARLDRDERRAWGARYLDRARCQRRLGRASFIDKLPANFRFVGLIRALLPQARVIDVRRDAAANGFSIFKQWFAGGYTFANDLEDIAAWRRDYLRFMRHWDEVLPGFVTRFDHDALVADPEPAIRMLLAAVDLPFDAACLVPHRTARPIRTPSGDQVREPIGPQWQDAWRPYARWLGPLTAT